MRPPNLDELVGAEIPPEERARLLRAHHALLEAGPPPELPTRLAAPAARRARRRSTLLAALAAALAALAASFAAGYLVADREGAFETARTVELRSSEPGSQAWGRIDIGPRDANGNWEMLVRVGGLERLPEGGYYTVYLTRGGEPVAPCGSFRIEQDVAEVRFSVSYRLTRFDGWVVTLQPPDVHEPGRVVLST